MRGYLATKRIAVVLGAIAVFATVTTSAQALDAYQDRTGLFYGAGFGGGTALQVNPDFKPGGAIFLDGQFGGGASNYLTLALDLEIGVHIWSGQNHWFINPGPEANFFITKEVFIRAGIGLPITFMNEEGEDTDATIGLDASIGGGWEFFANASLAVVLAIELDYVVLYQGDDTLVVGFSMGLRYY